MCLGGEEASDASLASRTGWLDLATRDWWQEAVDWSGASDGLCPATGHLGDRARPGRSAGAAAAGRRRTHHRRPRPPGGHGRRRGRRRRRPARLVRHRRGTRPHRACRFLRPTASPGWRTVGVTVGWHVLAGRWALLGATEGGLALSRVLSVLGGASRPCRHWTPPRWMRRTARAVSIGLDDSSRVTMAASATTSRLATCGGPRWRRSPTRCSTPSLDDLRRRAAPEHGRHRGVVSKRRAHAGEAARLRRPDALRVWRRPAPGALRCSPDWRPELCRCRRLPRPGAAVMTGSAARKTEHRVPFASQRRPGHPADLAHRWPGRRRPGRGRARRDRRDGAKGPHPAGTTRTAAPGPRRSRPVEQLSYEPDVAARTEFAEASSASRWRRSRICLRTVAVLLDAGSTTSRLADIFPSDRSLTCSPTRCRSP